MDKWMVEIFGINKAGSLDILASHRPSWGYIRDLKDGFILWLKSSHSQGSFKKVSKLSLLSNVSLCLQSRLIKC